jgi:hypothetical protein
MRRVSLLLLTGLLAGCVDELAVRQAQLSQLVGQPEAVLIQQLGVPSRSYETGGVKYLAYNEQRVDIVPGFPTYNPYFTGWYGGGFPPYAVDLRCETTFAIADGTVKSFTLRGNACG